eukprot:CAMPEP_0178401606 /NCGR_PEP_ID=MMETSP0689_2-20121128/16390_1 /TAXON_ID=160604 /ORGANISM="Amphidinium massartii, Strain CS-259" /LENGTH=68 /DNA_ID=CAMNT_0020022435 /DNA_START=119 /DNA_END=322 /DNA_ORIENTATION=-
MLSAFVAPSAPLAGSTATSQQQEVRHLRQNTATPEASASVSSGIWAVGAAAAAVGAASLGQKRTTTRQ